MLCCTMVLVRRKNKYSKYSMVKVESDRKDSETLGGKIQTNKGETFLSL
jgi:hypothetical protein